MRKSHVLALFGLTLILALILAACAGPGPTTGEAPAGNAETNGQANEAGGQANEEAQPRAATIHNAAYASSLYEQVHVAAMEKMAEQYGFQTSYVDQVEYAKTADTARSLAGDGTDLVIFTSGGHAAAQLEVAPEFPDSWFVLISSVTELPDSGNAAGWSVDWHEAGFLVGVVAALQTETGKVACVGGSAIPPIVFNCSGMIEGAKHINPDVEVEVAMVGDFVDTAKAKELGSSLIAQGVDVLFAPAGGAGQGVIQAADEAGVSAIGYTSDESFRAPDTVITSEVINFEQAYLDLGELYSSGTLEAEIYPMTVAGNHITYGPFGGRIKEGVEEQAKEIYEQIKNGELEVPHVTHEDIVQ